MSPGRLLPIALAASISPILAQTPPAAAPYSVPWHLRPASAVTVAAFNQTAARSESAAGESGTTWVSVLTGAFKVGSSWAPMARIAWTSNDPPGAAPSGHALSNGLVGATYARKLSSDLRFAAFVATTLPFGEGGGDAPDAGASRAQTDALKARSQMDNALFVPNYWTVLGGADLAWIAHGVTVQGEFTILGLDRVKGPATQDANRTNFTGGVHVGGFLARWASVGAEWRVQRWLSDAAPVRSDPAARSQSTVAIGPRFHLRVGRGVTIRPGINYAFALDDPMSGQDYGIVQLDVPVYF